MTKAPPAETISLEEARAIALDAQGFGRRSGSRVTRAQVRNALGRLGAVQLDSVNVLVRTQYLPAFSRLGAYDLADFDRLAYRDRSFFEGLAHAASFIPIELHPYLRWRGEPGHLHPAWAAWRARIEVKRPGYVDRILAELEERGPLTFGELSDPGRVERGPTKYAASTILWDRGSDGKDVLDWLFRSGRVAVAERRGFEPMYDLVERVIPAPVLERPAVPAAEARLHLVRVAALALGVATVKDLADYFRLSVAAAKAAAAELVAAGELRPARVEGWKDPAFVSAGARARRHTGAALVSPFDSLVWERGRTERLFGFRYRIEIYVPEAKRLHGYYVLPFLLGDRLAARVDLKADRKTGVLRVPGAFLEPGSDREEVLAALEPELDRMAAWLGLTGVEWGPRGDLRPRAATHISSHA